MTLLFNFVDFGGTTIQQTFVGIFHRCFLLHSRTRICAELMYRIPNPYLIGLAFFESLYPEKVFPLHLHSFDGRFILLFGSMVP